MKTQQVEKETKMESESFYKAKPVRLQIIKNNEVLTDREVKFHKDQNENLFLSCKTF